MTRSEWTICERSGRWAAAVRLASLRAKWPAAAMPRVFEVRRLVELEMRLDTQSSELVLVEVNRANFADMLPWLATASRLHPQVIWAALIDGDVAHRADREQLADALREAGANEVVDSPRQMQRILTLGRLRAATQQTLPNSPSAELPMMAWAWDSLPWQEE